MSGSFFTPINRAGWPFIAIFALLTLCVFLIWWPLGYIGVILTFWCIYFFRDPDREPPPGEGIVVSPADGIVQQIEKAVQAHDFGLGNTPLRRISIFMNVFNVHVNRIPINGKVSQLVYRPGKFINASLDKASINNECQCVRLTTKGGIEIGLVQIAGLIARRIKCYLIENQDVTTGQRFGLIRFGSRVDIYFPLGVEVFVEIGQKTKAGETIIADLNSTQLNKLTGTS